MMGSLCVVDLPPNVRLGFELHTSPSFYQDTFMPITFEQKVNIFLRLGKFSILFKYKLVCVFKI